ncbi:putative amphiphysin [Apostichopus japonicus]|uniref:Putative amphiphysin n=1 Tax=Stichopus japonicus TaxID=307972 RepID=A0A2G8LK84_STIJA|nr:putative amphiphysin [Apostichopus japonicus]
MERYTWHIMGLCEVRLKNSGMHLTDEGHVLKYSGEPDKRINGVGFLVNKKGKNSVMGYCPTSSRPINIRLRATPFNITLIQAYAPTTDYDDDRVEEFYNQLQDIIDGVDRKDVLIIQGDWIAKVGIDVWRDWKKFCGPSCNAHTNERGLRLLEFTSYNDMVLANTIGKHKASQRYTWHAPNGKHHNQIDYILVQNRFRSGTRTAATRTFPGADVGSDHDLVIMNFKVKLKIITKPKYSRLKFNLDKLKDPSISETFK